MAVVGYSVGKSWEKAAAISVYERIMLKTAHLWTIYVIAVPHCTDIFWKEIATPNILEGVMEGC